MMVTIQVKVFWVVMSRPQLEFSLPWKPQNLMM